MSICKKGNKGTDTAKQEELVFSKHIGADHDLGCSKLTLLRYWASVYVQGSKESHKQQR